MYVFKNNMEKRMKKRPTTTHYWKHVITLRPHYNIGLIIILYELNLISIMIRNVIMNYVIIASLVYSVVIYILC